LRAVLQRVAQASVGIRGSVTAAIQRGVLVLLAVEQADGSADIEWLSGKIVRLRIFGDAKGVMNQSVRDVQGVVLLVSQFTLFASTKKGNRPSYVRSAGTPISLPLYEQFRERLSQDLGQPVPAGQFGADMQVSLVNDGPVTILLDSQVRE
jgi:D-tyrosyl-tRNA(Tyr) deacylase